MPFDLTRWRAEVRALVADFARDPQGALARAGVNSVYGFLLGSSVLPIAAAYATDPHSAIAALISAAGGVSASLIANLAQRKYDAANPLAVAAQEAQSAELAPAYEQIAQAVEIIPLAEQALGQAGQTAILEQLREELRRLGKAGQFAGATIGVTQSGGVNFGIGNTIGQVGDVVAGNKAEGPQIFGNITSGRDTNIADTMTVTNTAAPTPPITPTPAALPGPALRLWLEDPRGAPLDTLTVGQDALLRLGVDGDITTLPALDLTLEADGAGVAWPDDTRRRLTLRPGAPPRSLRWTLIPQQAGPLTLRVLALVGGALVQQLALTVTCHDEVSSAVLSGANVALAPPQVSVPVGFTLASVPALPTHPNAITLVLDQEREGYRLLLLDGGSATACPLALTAMGLADLLAYAHTELLAIVNRQADSVYPYLQDVTIPAPEAERSLARLARLGAQLWQALFAGPGGSRDAVDLSERLRARSQAGALHLTITAAHLPFPWALLYDRDPSQAITAEGFWGFRHVLTTLPTSGRSGPKASDVALGAAPSLRALAGFNLAIDARTKPRSVIAEQRQALTSLGIVADEITTEQALRAALAAGADTELIYLYCHAVSALPDQKPRPGVGAPPGVGSTRLILTSDANALTLRDLQLAAPLSRAPLLRGGPLVILNACGSADLSPLTYDGLAPYLLDLGARAVVGTECDVPILFGAAFGPALLAAVIRERRPVGDALRAARRHFLEQHRNALGLLYALYGSADLHVLNDD